MEADKDDAEFKKEEESAIGDLTKGKKPEKVDPISPEEMVRALKHWQEANKKQPELYDYDFVLTTTQSRMEALRTRGYTLVLADPSVTKAIVRPPSNLLPLLFLDVSTARQLIVW